VHFVCKKNVTQDTYHETISKMDEFEMNYIFNELDTILELIHANCIVRNVRHILISTAVKTLILENVYERFFIRTEKKKYS
jgi:NH3-dependent NAD+ synthetase